MKPQSVDKTGHTGACRCLEAESQGTRNGSRCFCLATVAVFRQALSLKVTQIKSNELLRI